MPVQLIVSTPGPESDINVLVARILCNLKMKLEVKKGGPRENEVSWANVFLQMQAEIAAWTQQIFLSVLSYAKLLTMIFNNGTSAAFDGQDVGDLENDVYVHA